MTFGDVLFTCVFTILIGILLFVWLSATGRLCPYENAQHQAMCVQFAPAP